MVKSGEKGTNFDDFPITLQDENYNKGNKKLRTKKVKVHNKKVIDKVEMNVDVSLGRNQQTLEIASSYW